MDRFHPDMPESPGNADSAESVRIPGPVFAVAAVLAVCLASPALLAATGDETWYALPLTAAAAVVWRRGRLTGAELGLARGRGFYARATLLPLAAVGLVVWLATAVGATRVGEARLGLLAIQVSTMAVFTTMGTLVTEDGFFRGALWGLLDRRGRSDDEILLWTATAYALWYLPLVWLAPSPVAGPEALAVRTLNLWLLALAWGILRLVSGSLLVAAWSHGLWNGLAYTLFGFGASTGALGIVDPLDFDPERGWAGVAVNAAAVLILLRWWRAHEAAEALEAEEAADVAAAKGRGSSGSGGDATEPP
ncbi:MAG: CPBP family glutamic-type intramembrane protease [Gemmatimonadota bacterium]|nr:CPBP family glutamic-type intramembrane protease [Gemmatimonadota bacterium]